MASAETLAGGIDRFVDAVGRITAWTSFALALVMGGNVLLRYGFNTGSVWSQELEWHLMSPICLFGMSYALRHHEHVRVDVLYGGRGPRTKAWIDLLGLILFLMPSMIMLAWLSWPLFMDAWVRNEVSSNAGGLVRWPVKLLMPVGFVLVAIQGLAEIIKRIGFLRGDYNMDVHYERPVQ